MKKLKKLWISKLNLDIQVLLMESLDEVTGIWISSGDLMELDIFTLIRDMNLMEL